MARWSKLYRSCATWRRVLASGIGLAIGIAAVSVNLNAQQSQPAGTSSAAVRELRDIAEMQAQFLRNEEPQLARRYGKGSPQYVAALHARLEALSIVALAPQPAQPGGVRTYSKKALPPLDPGTPVVFPINEDPRAAKALELQRREIVRAVPPGGHTRYMYGGRPTIDNNGRDRFPHTVALKPAGGGSRAICSGVLVAARAVLTAQHCICIFKLGAGSEVHVGRRIGQAVVFRVSRVASFARQDCPPDAAASSPVFFGEDLALVFFGSPSPPAAIAPVGFIERIEVGTSLWVAGFGEQEDNDIGEKLTAPIGVVSPFCGHPTDPARYGCAAGKIPDLVRIVATAIAADQHSWKSLERAACCS